MRQNRHRALVLAAVMFCSACGMPDDLVESIVDLSTLEVTTTPSGSDVIIPATQRELRVRFSRTVNTLEAEELVSLISPDGHVAYDHRWNEMCLILAPVEPWEAGTRYVLSCRGTVTASKNRSYILDTECSFYVDTAAEPPVLLSFLPEQDAVVSASEPVVLHFSAPINLDDPGRHIVMSPEHPVVFTTRDDERTLVITPATSWKGLTRYHWLVHNTLYSSTGVRLYRQYSGTFRTMTDTTAPEKPDVFVCLIESPEGPHLPLETLTNGYGLVFSFNEAVPPESFIPKLTIMPDSHPVVRQLTRTDFLGYPESGKWTAGQKYTITIKKGLEDFCGNRTEESFVYTVIPDIPALTLLRGEPDSPVPEGPAFFTGEEMTSGTHIHPVAIETLTTCPLVITLTISEPLSPGEAQRLISSISFEPLFPHYIAPPQPGVVLFDPSADARILRLSYSGLQVPSRGIEEERVLYTFSIQGGKNGFSTDSGSFFPETLSVILETFEKEE